MKSNDNQSTTSLLGKKKLNVDEDLPSIAKSFIKKVSKEIRKSKKDFKISKQQEKRIIDRISQIWHLNSKDNILEVFSEEIERFSEIKLDYSEYTKPIITLLESDKFKRRIYDIDSNKKLLRKNIWNYIQKLLFSLSDISNIKAANNNIKHNTKKEFERILIEATVGELYETNYKITNDYILKNAIITKEESSKDKKKKINGQIKGQNKSSCILSETEIKKRIENLLKRTFKEMFIEYRESKEFWIDAVEDCNDDRRKFTQYIMMASKFINYVEKKEKTTLESLDDDHLPKNFYQKYNLSLENFEIENKYDSLMSCNVLPECGNEVKSNNMSRKSINNFTSFDSTKLCSEPLSPNLEKNIFDQFLKLPYHEKSILFNNIKNFMKDLCEYNLEDYNRSEEQIKDMTDFICQDEGKLNDQNSFDMDNNEFTKY